MVKLLILQISLLFCYSVNADSLEDLSGEKWLNDDYLLKWKTDNTAKKVTLKVEVRTKGWIGFGFSKRGLTNEADIVIGWVDNNGKPTLKDFWVSESFTRSLDTSQDWHLMTASENETHTVLEFCRKYITCDSEHDLEIFENEFELSNIIFSYGLTDPINIDSIGDPYFEDFFHLNLFFPEDYFEPKEKDIQVFDYQMNVTIPPKAATVMSNLTFCKIFKFKHSNKRTLVKTQPIIVPYMRSEINHHIATVACPQTEAALFEKNLDEAFDCYGGASSYLRTKCTRLEVLQSVMTKTPFSFPSEVGFPLDPLEGEYFLVEAHLINPTFKQLNVSLTVRMWTTEKMRKYEAQFKLFSTSLGIYSSYWGFVAPPKQLNFKITSVVDTYCFEQADMGNDGIYIFAVLFHSHYSTDVETRHFRNEKLVGTLRFYDYDNWYQPWAILRKPIHLLKGDKFVFTCQINTINETTSFTSPQEHCLLSLYTYPRLRAHDDNTVWNRLPYKTMLNITGLQQIDNYDYGGIEDMVVRKPVQFNNTKLVDFIKDNKYRLSDDPRQLEKIMILSEMEMYCSNKDLSKTKYRETYMITKPPGLYEQLDNKREQNTCPSDNAMLNSENPRTKSESTSFGFQSLNQLKLSFSVIMKSFKMSFALLV